MVLESFLSPPKSGQESLEPIWIQFYVETTEEGDKESASFDNGQVQESEEESSHLQKDDQVTIYEISLEGLETALMPGSLLVLEEQIEQKDPDLHSSSFSEEIIHSDINKEQTNDRNFKDLNSQVKKVAEKPHMCLYCGQTSSCKAYLVAHERTHTGEKPYTCLDCGKCFNRKSTLVRHKRMHTGEKPYECTKCGRRFSVRCNLTNHERIHTGEKPYSCSNCGQSFSRRMQFVIHKRTHTGETPHRCTQCGKCFTRRSTLLTHERIHTGKKPNTGTNCAQEDPHRRETI
nr:zinc finger protein 436-like [Anolis sagrei ordinatus]